MLFIRHTAARQPQPLIGQSLHGLMWLQNELDAKCKHCPVADPDLQMGGGGGGVGIPTLRKEGGASLKKNFSGPSGLSSV